MSAHRIAGCHEVNPIIEQHAEHVLARRLLLACPIDAQAPRLSTSRSAQKLDVAGGGRLNGVSTPPRISARFTRRASARRSMLPPGIEENAKVFGANVQASTGTTGLIATRLRTWV